MEPFSVMLRDLLKMFERAGAQYSDKNINIHFDFDASKGPLDVNLEHFRLFQEKVEKTVRNAFQIERCNPFRDFYDPLDRIINCDDQRKCINRKRMPDEIVGWLEEYRNCDYNWPSYFPLPPQSGIQRIDKVVEELWILLKAACKIYRDCFDPSLKRGSFLQKSGSDDYHLFFQAESDHWLGSVVEFISILVCEARASKCEADGQSRISEIAETFECIRDHLPIEAVTIEQRVKEFLDIINLPVWEKRYALYSAWVSTQIVSAFDEETVRFNVENNVLSFSFGGSIIAYIQHNDYTLSLVAELRTSYDGVIGDGRKYNIQPDYSLCINDKDKKENTVLVVECKQYKRAQRRNFNEAIVDYAGGRPNAQVALVNYTRIPKSFRAALPKDVSERVPFFGALIPGDPSCDAFKQVVRDSVPTKCQICLFWNKNPADMELVFIVSDPTGASFVVDCSDINTIHNAGITHCSDKSNRFVFCAAILPSEKLDVFVRKTRSEEIGGEVCVWAGVGKNVVLAFKSANDLNESKDWHAMTIEHSRINLVDRIVERVSV